MEVGMVGFRKNLDFIDFLAQSSKYSIRNWYILPDQLVPSENRLNSARETSPIQKREKFHWISAETFKKVSYPFRQSSFPKFLNTGFYGSPQLRKPCNVSVDLSIRQHHAPSAISSKCDLVAVAVNWPQMSSAKSSDPIPWIMPNRPSAQPRHLTARVPAEHQNKHLLGYFRRRSVRGNKLSCKKNSAVMKSHIPLSCFH